MILYGIFDTKANRFVNVFPSINDDTAKRSFEQLLSTPEESVFNQSPEDFNLLKVISLPDDYTDVLKLGCEVVKAGNEYSRSSLVELRTRALDERNKILERSPLNVGQSK